RAFGHLSVSAHGRGRGPEALTAPLSIDQPSAKNNGRRWLKHWRPWIGQRTEVALARSPTNDLVIVPQTASLCNRSSLCRISRHVRKRAHERQSASMGLGSRPTARAQACHAVARGKSHRQRRRLSG